MSRWVSDKAQARRRSWIGVPPWLPVKGSQPNPTWIRRTRVCRAWLLLLLHPGRASEAVPVAQASSWGCPPSRWQPPGRYHHAAELEIF